MVQSAVAQPTATAEPYARAKAEATVTEPAAQRELGRRRRGARERGALPVRGRTAKTMAGRAGASEVDPGMHERAPGTPASASAPAEPMQTRSWQLSGRSRALRAVQPRSRQRASGCKRGAGRSQLALRRRTATRRR
jgi:hypothetical protein